MELDGVQHIVLDIFHAGEISFGKGNEDFVDDIVHADDGRMDENIGVAGIEPADHRVSRAPLLKEFLMKLLLVHAVKPEESNVG